MNENHIRNYNPENVPECRFLELCCNREVDPHTHTQRNINIYVRHAHIYLSHLIFQLCNSIYLFYPALNFIGFGTQIP